jgi:hypothetical protein
MDNRPTLIDRCLRETFRKRSKLQSLRNLFVNARRFVLDDEASSFLGDLFVANYDKQQKIRNPVFGLRIFDATRMLARLPHKITWLEYQYQPFVNRYCKLAGNDNAKTAFADSFGFLMQQHSQIETAFRLSIFCGRPNDNSISMFPCDAAWRTDDGPIPWRPMANAAWMVSSAIGISTPSILVDNYDLVKPIANIAPTNDERTLKMAMFSSGCEFRRAVVLLSSINDIPMGVKHVIPTHGFVAQGRYRKFLNHTIISIILPKGRDPYKLARSIVAMARRRAHQVRGHWRRDWRNPLSRVCEHHFDPETMICNYCGGRKLWIDEHARGDASLGFVTHDYRVTK